MVPWCCLVYLVRTLKYRSLRRPAVSLRNFCKRSCSVWGFSLSIFWLDMYLFVTKIIDTVWRVIIKWPSYPTKCYVQYHVFIYSVENKGELLSKNMKHIFAFRCWLVIYSRLPRRLSAGNWVKKNPVLLVNWSCKLCSNLSIWHVRFAFLSDLNLSSETSISSDIRSIYYESQNLNLAEKCLKTLWSFHFSNPVNNNNTKKHFKPILSPILQFGLYTRMCLEVFTVTDFNKIWRWIQSRSVKFWCIWSTWHGCKAEKILLNSVRFASSACPEGPENNLASHESRTLPSRVKMAGSVSSPQTYTCDLLSLASSINKMLFSTTYHRTSMCCHFCHKFYIICTLCVEWTTNLWVKLIVNFLNV
jgi:hypothetical protein